MNNGGQYCSIRAYLDQDYQGMTQASTAFPLSHSYPPTPHPPHTHTEKCLWLAQGCAAPCDPASTGNWNHAPTEQVQLWFR